MNNLVNIQDGKVVVSSRMVAEKFGKEHSKVLRSIEGIISETPIMDSHNMFHESRYKVDGNNKTYPEFIMNKLGFSVLTMGFTGSEALRWKIEYAKAFEVMEDKLRSPFVIPQTFTEALALALEQSKTIDEQSKALTIAEPKVAFYDAVTQSDTWFNMQSVAAILAIKGLGRNNLFTFLVKHGILIDTVTPYRTQIDNGNFKVVEGVYVSPKTGVNVVSKKVVASQKGIDAVRRLYYGKS